MQPSLARLTWLVAVAVALSVPVAVAVSAPMSGTVPVSVTGADHAGLVGRLHLTHHQVRGRRLEQEGTHRAARNPVTWPATSTKACAAGLSGLEATTGWPPSPLRTTRGSMGIAPRKGTP